jgi:hypothetical protein
MKRTRALKQESAARITPECGSALASVARRARGGSGMLRRRVFLQTR